MVSLSKSLSLSKYMLALCIKISLSIEGTL